MPKSSTNSRIQNLLNSYTLNPFVIWKNLIWRFPKYKSNGSYIFIVGSPRSGTTLLQLMLAQHSKLFSYQRESEVFSYRNIFDSERIWFGLPINLIEMLQSNSFDIVEYFDSCVEIISKGENKNKRFVEKTPQHVLHLPFILRWFPNAKIIQIVRDGRDCYCSSKTNVHIPQNKSVNTFAKYWRKCVSKPIQFSQNIHLYSIRYEDLVSSPQASLAGIMKYLELDVEDAQLDSTQFSKDIRSQRIEFKKLATEINAYSVNRWQQELSTKEAAKFKQIAGEQLTYYGYD